MIGIPEQYIGLLQCPSCAALSDDCEEDEIFECKCCGSEFYYNDLINNEYKHAFNIRGKYFLKIIFRRDLYFGYDKVEYGDIPYKILSLGCISIGFGKLPDHKKYINIKKAIEKVYSDLKGLSSEEFNKLMNETEGGIFTIILKELERYETHM